MAKRGIGKAILKGFDSIMDEEQGNVMVVPVRSIVENEKFKIRLESKRIDSLARDIKVRGQLTPLFVRPSDSGGFELISGYRRLEALKRNKADKVQVRNFPNLSDEKAMELAVAENIQREDLTPLEKAFLCEKLFRDGRSRAEIARIVFPTATVSGAESERNVQNYLTVARTDERIKKALQEEKITFSVALLLAEALKGRKSEDVFTPPNTLEKVLKEIVKNKLSVREVEEYLRSLKEGKKKRPVKKQRRAWEPVVWKEEKKGWQLQIRFRMVEGKAGEKELDKIEREIEKALEKIREFRKTHGV
jgi:ParB family chromosome partitioning protein